MKPLISEAQQPAEAKNIPSGLQALVGDAEFCVGIAYIEGNATQDGEVLRGIAATNPAIVFLERHVQHPVLPLLFQPRRIVGDHALPCFNAS